MSDQYGSRFGRPDPQPDDLEAILTRTLRSEAEKIHPVGDGLTKIRARTEGRRSVFGWFAGPAARPVLAGGTLVLTLVAGTMIGLQVTGGDDDRSTVVDGPRDPVAVQPQDTTAPLIQNDQLDAERYNPDPGEDIGDTGGSDFPVTTEVTENPAATRLAPVTPDQERKQSDEGIPVDNGGNYVAITSPLSGRNYDSPLTIAGVARVFEANVTVDVSQNGTVLKRTHATATEGAPELGDWQVTLELAPGNYRIDAYSLSAKDGETKLASDSIWITIRPPANATQPTPTPSPSPSSSPSATPSSTATPSTTAPRSDVPADDD